MDYTAVNGVSLFEIFKTIKQYADYDFAAGITLAGGIVTVLATVNFICIINAVLGTLMLLIKKIK